MTALGSARRGIRWCALAAVGTTLTGCAQTVTGLPLVSTAPHSSAVASTAAQPSRSASDSAVPGSGGGGIDPSQVNYDWNGGPVAGPSTRLPDGTYYCYLSNAPSASYTYWGAMVVSGNELLFNASPGTIGYTSTTAVVITGAGFLAAPSAVVFAEAGDGKIVLWLRYHDSDSRCA